MLRSPVRCCHASPFCWWEGGQVGVGHEGSCTPLIHSIPPPPPFFLPPSPYLSWLRQLSGFAEPLAVIGAGIVFPASGPEDSVVSALLAGVAGVMGTLSVVELLPSAATHLSRAQWSAFMVLGGVVMTGTLVAADALQRYKQGGGL